MKWIRRVSISLSLAAIAASCTAMLVFGLGEFGWKALAIPTGSMRPGIPPGSMVLVKSVPIPSLRVGDVITHINPLNPKVTISHRIKKIYTIRGNVPVFVTKGDANPSSDPPITASDIIGKVVWHAPDLGWVLLYSKKPIVILPIVYISALLICAEETQRLNVYYKSRLPYRVKGYITFEFPKKSYRKIYLSTSVMLFSLILLSYLGPVALAQLKSNTLAVTNNKISVAPVKTNTCSGSTNNNTSISVTSTNTQSATTGSVQSSGGPASSGSASNNSSTTVNINVTNC